MSRTHSAGSAGGTDPGGNHIEIEEAITERPNEKRSRDRRYEPLQVPAPTVPRAESSHEQPAIVALRRVPNCRSELARAPEFE
jgi:hypothetical protein